MSLSDGEIEVLLGSATPYILFSGGKDSLATLMYLNKLASKTSTSLVALHVDTTVGFPETLSYVKDVCSALDVELQIVRPDTDYFTLANQWGIPAFNSRWCCRELKIKPIAEFLKTVPGSKIVFDGIRAAESSLRATYMPIWFHPGFRCLSVSPIFQWSDEEVYSRACVQGLPERPHLDLGSSTECWCGAYKTRSDFEALHRLNPSLYDKLEQVEANNKFGFTFIYEKGERISLQAIRTNLEAG